MADEPLSLDDDETPMQKLKARIRRSTRKEVAIVAAVSILLIVLAISLATRKSNRDESADSGGGGSSIALSSGPPADGGKKLEDYTRDLMRKIPIEPDPFAKQGFKAISYEMNPSYPTIFAQLTMAVDRVYLTDRITGRGQWYTRAKLTANNPSPGGRNSIPVPFDWVKVEMLP